MADGAKTQVAPGKVNVFWNQLLTQQVHPKKTWCLVPIAIPYGSPGILASGYIPFYVEEVALL